MATKAVLPVQYFESNHIVVRNDLQRREWHVGYRLPGFVYEFLSDEEKKLQLSKLTKLFWDINLDFQLLSVPVTSNVDEHFARLKHNITGTSKVAAIVHFDNIKEILEDTFEEENDYELFLIIRLENLKFLFKNFREFVQGLTQDPKRLVNEFMGSALPEIYLRELTSYSDAEEMLFSKLNSLMPGMTKLSEWDTQRLIRRPFWRGISEPPMRRADKRNANGSNYWKPAYEEVALHGDKAIRPYRKEILTLSEGVVDISPPRHIEVEQTYRGELKRVLQTFLVISHIPDLVFPRSSEWFYALQQRCNFPVEISVRCTPKNYREALTAIRNQKKSVEDQMEHNTEAGEEIPIDLDEKADDLRIFEADIKKQRYPLLETTVVICVTAPDPKELTNRVEDVKKVLDGYGIQAEQPAYDQWKLFNEMMVGGKRYAKDYVKKLPPYLIAGGMPGATNKLGDNEGFYIGVTGENPKPVYFGPWLASLLNKSPSITWSGTLGTGKSMLFNDCIVSAVLCGAKAILVDPKNERGHWPQYLPELEGQIRVTTLSARDEDRGKLDPYNLFVHNIEIPLGMSREEIEKKRQEGIKLANNYAISILSFLIGADRKDPRSRVLMTAVTRAGKKPKPSMNKVIDTLKEMSVESESDDKRKSAANDIAEHLEAFKDMALAQLLFGNGNEEALSSNVALNIIQIEGLELPEEGTTPEHYTHEQVISVACMLGICGYAKKFAMGPRHIVKIFGLDEASMVTGTQQGKRLVQSHVRMGRSMNSPIWLISQNTDDFTDEKVKNNITVKFVYRCPDETEARKVLKFLNLKENEENIAVLRELPTGTCIMQDVYGRTGILVVDIPIQRWFDCFDTRPPGANHGDEEDLDIHSETA